MTRHQDIVLAFVAAKKENIKLDVLELGEKLVSMGLDDTVDGGFWIWDIKTGVEFFSPNFRASLGGVDEKKFPSLATSWQTWIDPQDSIDAQELASQHIASKGKVPYRLIVKYKTLIEDYILNVVCSGTAIWKDLKDKDPIFFIGSHQILN